MTPETIAHAKDRIAYWQARLRLADWHIRLSAEPPGPENRASHESHVDIRSAVVQLHPEIPWDQVDREVLHELLHIRLVLLERSTFILRHDTSPLTDSAFKSVWELSLEAAIEALCDALGANPRREWDPARVEAPWLNLA